MRSIRGGAGRSPYCTYRGIESDTHAIVDGNWNNTGHAGTFYVNLNNTVSNTNTNNGAALPDPTLEDNRMLFTSLASWQK